MQARFCDVKLRPLLKVKSYGLFIRGGTSYLGETSHLVEVIFIPQLCDKNIPPE